MSPLAARLTAALKAQGFPYEVRDGPQALRFGPRAQAHVELSRDRVGGDSLGPGKGRKRNPRILYTRTVGYLLRVYVGSTSSGSSAWDHECLCDVVVEQLIQAVDTVARIDGRSLWEYRSGRFLTTAELAETKMRKWPSGVVYDLIIEIGRSVAAVGFDQAIADEAPIGEPGGIVFEQPAIVVDGGAGAADRLPGATTRTA